LRDLIFRRQLKPGQKLLPERELARSLGVTAVPTFVAGGRGLVGAQPYPELKRLVHAARNGEILL